MSQRVLLHSVITAIFITWGPALAFQKDIFIYIFTKLIITCVSKYKDHETKTDYPIFKKFRYSLITCIQKLGNASKTVAAVSTNLLITLILNRPT